MKKHNFCAGPSHLPDEVYEKTAQAVINYNNSGLSLLEISHRNPLFTAILEEARTLALELLDLTNKGYQALFLHGGASMEFLRIPHNLLKINGKSVYLDTGTWANNAIRQAQYIGTTIVSASSKTENYNHIPKVYEIPTDADYFHCTSNNTIFGTQIKNFPKTSIPIVCDMSSDIFSRNLDFSQFGILYAGAQKNIGAAGVSLVIVKEELLGKTSRIIPEMLNYQTHIERESMFNTPPVLAIYTCLLTLKWVKKNGGITEMEKRNFLKSDTLYNEIDRNPLFSGTAIPEDRSAMNAVFILNDTAHTNAFDELCRQADITGLHGHRSVGGYRASMYNALEISSVHILVEVMQELERKM